MCAVEPWSIKTGCSLPPTAFKGETHTHTYNNSFYSNIAITLLCVMSLTMTLVKTKFYCFKFLKIFKWIKLLNHSPKCFKCFKLMWIYANQINSCYKCRQISDFLTIVRISWLWFRFFRRGKAEDTGTWRIVLGKHKLKQTESVERIFPVERIYRHERFRNPAHGDLDYDIALVKSGTDILPSKFIRYACLPRNRTNLKPGHYCWVTGWGDTRGNHVSVIPNRAQQAQNHTLNTINTSYLWLRSQYIYVCIYLRASQVGKCHMCH